MPHTESGQKLSITDIGHELDGMVDEATTAHLAAIHSFRQASEAVRQGSTQHVQALETLRAALPARRRQVVFAATALDQLGYGERAPADFAVRWFGRVALPSYRRLALGESASPEADDLYETQQLLRGEGELLRQEYFDMTDHEVVAPGVVHRHVLSPVRSLLVATRQLRLDHRDQLVAVPDVPVSDVAA